MLTPCGFETMLNKLPLRIQGLVRITNIRMNSLYNCMIPHPKEKWSRVLVTDEL